jgi:hypothetical protein
MSNPTSAKPATSYFDVTNTFGATAQAVVGLTEGIGYPMDCVARQVPQAGMGASNLGLAGHFTLSSLWSGRHGPFPKWNASGFSPRGTNFGPSLHFDHGSPGLLWQNSGWPIARKNGAQANTIVCLFKHHIQPFNRHNAVLSYPLVMSSDHAGVAVALDCIGPFPTDKLQLYTFSNAAATYPGTPIEVLPDRWYMAGVAYGSGASPTTKTFFLWDYESDAAHPASGQTVSDTNTGFLNDTYLNLLAYGQVSANPFIGDIAFFGLFNEAFTPSRFAALVADPWQMCRLSYTPSGALTAGKGRQFDATKTSVSLSWTRATGIGSNGGNGALNYQVWWVPSTNANATTITPGSAGSTQLPGGNVTVVGDVISATHTGMTPNSDNWYTVKVTDAAGAPQQSVNYLPVPAKCHAKDPINALVAFSDSKLEITAVIENIMAMAAGDNRAITIVNCARTAAGLGVSSYANWVYNATVAAANQVVTLNYFNTASGPTGGTFNLVIPPGGANTSALTISTIPYNATSTNLQTALDAATNAAYGQTGLLVAGGGPFPGTPLTITGSGGTFADAKWPLPQYDLAGSALTGQTATTAGTSVGVAAALTTVYNSGTAAQNLYNYAVSECNRVDSSIKPNLFIVNDGANVTANGTWQTNLQNGITHLLADCPSLQYGVIMPAQVWLASAANAASIQQTNWVAAWSFQPLIANVLAALANPNIVMGDNQNMYTSIMGMDTNMYGDVLHETTTANIVPMVAFNYYKSITALVDPAVGGGGGSSGGSGCLEG